jgi:hypothetical protein
MTKSKFWQLIGYSRSDFDPNRLNGNQERQIKLMEEALGLLPEKELEDYEKIFNEYFFHSYTWDHWLSIHLIEGGVSDDFFDYFRAWMISMGEKPFLEMLACAYNVADYAKAPGVGIAFFEEFLEVASLVYEEKTGANFPDSCDTLGRPMKPAGREWRSDDFEYFKTAFPKSWSKRCRISWPD